MATKIEYDDPDEIKDPHLYYDNYIDLLKDVEINKKFSINRLIVFNGEIDTPDGGKIKYNNQVTTLGRLRLSKMIGADIDTIPGLLKQPLTQIDGGSASRLVSYLQQFPDYIERLNEIQKYALRVVTAKGVVTFDFDTLYAETDNDTYRDIKAIADSDKYTDKQKSLLITEKYKEYLSKVQSTVREDVKKDIKDANRVKIDSIVAMVAPSFIVSGVDEKPIINTTTLVNGMSSKDYIYHAIENRSLQSIKQSGTPSSGFLSRQLRFLMSDYVYKMGEDPDNKCILIPKYRSEGRVSPTGKIYPKFNGKPNEDDLVPVRSIVTKSKELGVVTPDLISTLYHFDMKDNDPIGISFATSLTQSITQHSLSLKHGGHERVLDETGFFRAPEGCRVIDDPKWIILSCRGGKELRYPKPSNFVMNDKPKYQKDDLIGTAYRTTSPIYTLNCLIKLMRARGSDGARYFEKDDVLVSDCYAYETGIIHYVTDNETGELSVKIGDIYYDYNPEAMYYFPDGYEVKQYQRFCSGVCNIRKVTNDLQDPAKIYTIFRRQFYDSSSKDYHKNKVIDSGDNREEIVELTYVSLTHTEMMSDGTYDIDYKGVHSGIMDNDSFFTLLSYGYSGKVVSRALKGDIELKGDASTRTVLGLLLNNKLDE